ncbi:MAG: hypothetical protein K2X03_16265 [Bryobacteraceae bacterium]|nr:hypothetical protein [Bryobacteraceae bacterium]
MLFQTMEELAKSGRKLTDETRHRLAARLKNLDTPSVRPYPLSLEPDPIHPSSYYLAVDGLNHGRVAPLLLRLGLASSPASGLFPKSVLIGRMRPAGGREVVVNAVPFGPTDAEPLRTFHERVTKAFQPRPQGTQAALIVSGQDLAVTAPIAFEDFRRIQRDTGQNRAAFSSGLAPAEAAYLTVLWAATRAGWRDGYSLGVTGIPAGAESQAALEKLPGFSRYTVLANDLEEAAGLYDHLRRVKLGAMAGQTRGFDFELDFTGLALTAELLGETLQAWRAAGRPVSSIVPPADSDLEALSAAARQLNALLTLPGSIGLRAHGRGHRAVADPGPGELAELARD